MRLEVETRLQRVRGLLHGFPLLVWGVALVLGATGVLFIHSATLDAPRFAGQDARQGLALVVLAVCAVPIAYLGRAWIVGHAWAAYGVVFTALLLVPVFGVTINGARRWFGFGGMTIQPTEFMKPALVLVLAHYLRYRSRAGFVEGVAVPLALTFAPMLLMMRQPDLGSALSLVPVTFAMCYAGGARPRSLVLLGLLGALCLVLLFPTLHDYQRERVLVWVTPARSMSPEDRLGAGYHLYQTLIAVGSGGFWGSGLFEGLQNRYDFLPYRSTDFLFSVVAEETGFAGATLLVAVYTGFCLLMLGQAASIRDRFGRLLATGVASLFATHLFVHAGVCTGLLPPTGLPLPLLSYGRSSVAGAWVALGLFAHALVGRQRNLAGDMYL